MEASRYDDVVRVLSDPATFSSELRRVLPGDPGNESVNRSVKHHQMRDIVAGILTPAVVRRLEPRVAAVSAGLLDRLVAGAATDFVADVAHPLPLIVMAELLGVPPSDHELIRGRAHRVVCAIGADRGGSPSADTVNAALDELLDYLREYVRGRRRSPGTDLTSRLMRIEVDGRPLVADHVAGLAQMLLLAGYANTTLVLANTVFVLAERPEVTCALRDDPGLVPTAIEEVMRYLPAVTASVRRTTRSVELGARVIGPDQLIYASHASAHRDERRFRDPDRFDIRRNPNQHLGFGYGSHYCLGARLARMEIRIAVRQILDRFAEIHFDPDAVPEISESFGSFGLRTLPVVFGQAASGRLTHNAGDPR